MSQESIPAVVFIKGDLSYPRNVQFGAPFVGEIVLDEEGLCKIENIEAAQKLAELNIGFSIHQLESKPPVEKEVEQSEEELEEIGEKSESNDITGKVAGEVEVVTDEEESLKEEDLSETLKNKTRKELEELCKEFPAAEWRGMNKAEMIEFILSKLSQ